MFLVNITQARNVTEKEVLKEAILQLHILFISPNHQAIEFCDANFVLLNRRTFQPFRWDPNKNTWCGFGRGSNSSVFRGRECKINVAVAAGIPWPYGEAVSQVRQTQYNGQPRLLYAPWPRLGDKTKRIGQSFCPSCTTERGVCTRGLDACLHFHDYIQADLHEDDRDWAPQQQYVAQQPHNYAQNSYPQDMHLWQTRNHQKVGIQEQDLDHHNQKEETEQHGNASSEDIQEQDLVHHNQQEEHGNASSEDM